MDAAQAKEVLDKIVGQVFGYQNPFSLEQFMQKYAFDVRLPQQVYDATTNQVTWAQSTNPTRFITMQNAWDMGDAGWERPKRELTSIQDVLAAWNDVNLTATERQIDSHNVAESDNTYFSENIYRSIDCTRSKNVIFSDGMLESEFIAASQRSKTSTFCIRLEDSQQCANSFGVSWSGSITNSLFMHDCKDMSDSMFCSHMSGKQYCVANMQYTKEEYEKLRDIVVRWILSS